MAPYLPLPAHAPLGAPHQPAAGPARLALATALHGASRVLAALAQRLAQEPQHAAAAALPQQLEFHAEAGAPEGALYADGVLVALLPGVSRL